VKSFGMRRTFVYAAVTKDKRNDADGRFGAACYARLAALREMPPFEEYYELADYLATARELAGNGERHVLEAAIELEAMSLDLYRSLAEQAGEGEVRAALLEMSGQEKAHLSALAERLGGLPQG
jgi:hypothetical protein